MARLGDYSNESVALKRIAEILAPVFAANEWRWASYHAINGIPTAAEIHRLLTQLLADTKDEVASGAFDEGGYVGTGRLRVTASWNTEGSECEYLVSLELGTL